MNHHIKRIVQEIRGRDYVGAIYTGSWYTIIHKQREDCLNMIPSFQRGVVWDNVKKSRLIESLIYGIPIPNIFLILNQDESFGSEETEYIVVDGKQRINGFLAFLGLLKPDDEDYENNNFALVGCKDSSLDGYKIQDFKGVLPFRHMTLAMITIPTNLSREEALKVGAMKFLELVDLGEPIEEEHLKKVRRLAE